jgi:steroid delta-isomerase-like uncharacterized protein
MSVEANKALIRQLEEEVWNKGNLAAADAIFARDMIDHGQNSTRVGPEDEKRRVADYRATFSDGHTHIEDIIAEGDKVVVRWRGHGTHDGALRGAAPTGNEVTVTGINIYRIADGKIVEQWRAWDALGMLQQLGLVPMPGASGT